MESFHACALLSMPNMFILTESWQGMSKSVAVGSNLDVNLRLSLTTRLIISTLANPSNASEVEERRYLCYFNKNRGADVRLVPPWLVPRTEQQDTRLLVKEEHPSKGGDARGRERQQRLLLSVDIDTIKGLFSICCQHFAACDINPMSGFSCNCLLAELFQIALHCVLHQQHTFHSEALARLTCVLIYTCFFCTGLCCLQLIEIFPSSSAPSSCLSPRLLLPFHIL